MNDDSHITGFEPQLSQNHNGDEPMLGGERRIKAESDWILGKPPKARIGKMSPIPEVMLERYYTALDEMNLALDTSMWNMITDGLRVLLSETLVLPDDIFEGLDARVPTPEETKRHQFDPDNFDAWLRGRWNDA